MKLIIAVDPGCSTNNKKGAKPNNGVCIAELINTKNKLIKPLIIKTMFFWDAVEVIKGYKDYHMYDAHVIIERSSTKKVWHKGGTTTAVNVGMVLGVAKMWEDYCIHNKISYSTVEPCGKVDKESFIKVTGWDKFAVDQHSIDAAMMAWRHVNANTKT